MFFKKKNAAPLLHPTIESFDTIIGPSTTIHGRVVADTGLRIDGEVIGDIEAQQNGGISVALGKTGRVQGDIHAFRVLIAGQVDGHIYATERVELHAGAKVTGDVTYGQLGIEEGASISGLMISKSGESPVGAYDPSMLVLQNPSSIKTK
ncbi:polymer-forming cytoskeletal protein [Polynucleobacter sp. AM-25C3]|uniref:bactofilin family protein n=1 Tax=Polynucleobacter sp. AM-25C3 TaxID=1855569 RepID=UPI001C0C6410|nr:polymer-forming cytoskeletal protein [Polynucleobacter sp. AM-25C3]MBU3602596.1 polymer-forming cytoskeletal protein [Polynucleobacter sp. AM-25C3]